MRFQNEIQAKRHEKATGEKVAMGDIAFALSAGNKKLKNNATTSFYQWNITSVESCPFRTGMCEASCYSLKAEKMYPTVKKRRDSNFEASKQDWFVPAMIEQIEFELSRKKNKGKRVLFRIHEAGDFYSNEYMDKWVQIANHFAGNEQIVFMAYTKSLPFVKVAFKKYGDDNVNITFKSSIWDDTKDKFKRMTDDLGMSVFTALPKGQVEQEGYIPCPSSETFKNTEKEQDCGTCQLCYLVNKDVAIEIH